ncbi:MAG: class I SAM-dependent methyltransferase [Candidatus Bilamarchaeaceae archaeon]
MGRKTGDTAKGVKRHFARTVANYDTVCNRVVFKNQELHECIVGALPFGNNEKISVLDLGCGTGRGMELVLKRFPNSYVSGMDFSARMLKTARRNLQGFRGRYELVKADFTTAELRGPYDAVISSIATHNCEHEQQTGLFSRIIHHLKSGGIFVNGDFIEAETPAINAEYRALYRNFLMQNLSGNELDVWLAHASTEDKPMKLSEHFASLYRCGFIYCRLLWQFNNEAVYSAIKP